MNEIKQSEDHQKIVSTSLEVTVKVGLALGLIFLCFLILRPFFLISLWGIIIAVSIHPLFLSLGKLLGNRKPMAAIIITII
ncbi:MAG: AI-2E family transporter, partial [Bacteroidota bacterium]